MFVCLTTRCVVSPIRRSNKQWTPRRQATAHLKKTDCPVLVFTISTESQCHAGDGPELSWPSRMLCIGPRSGSLRKNVSTMLLSKLSFDVSRSCFPDSPFSPKMMMYTEASVPRGSQAQVSACKSPSKRASRGLSLWDPVVVSKASGVIRSSPWASEPAPRISLVVTVILYLQRLDFGSLLLAWNPRDVPFLASNHMLQSK